MELLNLIKEAFSAKLQGISISPGEFLLNLLIAIILVIAGVVIGKLVKFTLRMGIEKINLTKLAKSSFINLFLTVIKWSIYILFINLALIQIRIPSITGWLTTILGVIPSLTGALIIIGVGFAIANYLKRIITDSKVGGWQMLSQVFFYFVIYIFIIFALKTALLSLQDKLISDILLITFTILGGVGLLISYFKTKKQ